MSFILVAVIQTDKMYLAAIITNIHHLHAMLTRDQVTRYQGPGVNMGRESRYLEIQDMR